MGGKTSKPRPKRSPEENKKAVIVRLSGGLGNQLFEIANGYAYSLRHNRKFLITKTWDGISKDRPSYWNTCLKNLNQYLIEERRIKGVKKYIESKFSYTEIPKFRTNTCLKGYYQSEKYFSDYKDQIRNLLTLPNDLIPDFNFEKEGINVAIHIRRGDYLKNPEFHIVLDKFYYDNAKQLIETKLGFRPNYYYFSEDIEWVRETFKDTMTENDKIISGYKDYEELYLMSQCDHFIIANSSFSWWGAWLSVVQSEEDKIVICPDQWFGPSGIKDYEDIYCENWIKIPADNLKLENPKDEYLNIDRITSSISEPINTELNPFDIYIINLKHRTDRREEVLNDLKDTTTFNVKFFDAVKHQKGWIGCGLSHLSLIKYAYDKDLPYIIVTEDDFKITLDDEKLKDALQILTSNLNEWDIFNGTANFWDKRYNISEIIFYKLNNIDLDSKFVNGNWGQSTSFMIYNKSSYSKMLSYNFVEHIDQYISKKFIQTFYKPEVFSIQKASYSDVSNKKLTEDIEIFLTTQYDIIKKSIPKDKTPIIGIYSIFIDKYQFFYENFIKNCEENFLPQYTKYYYIVTDNNELPKINDRTIIFNTEKIGWPYETLYRFKYFLQFKEDINKSDIIYFINSNGKFIDIDYKVLPDDSGYVFTKHHGYLNKSYNDLPYEKNMESSAFIRNQKIKFEYFGGRFYGATRENFLNLCNTLNDNIDKDEKNNHIALWHDESHINKYCLSILNYKFKKLGIEYHIPEEFSSNYSNIKIIYLNKNNYIKMNNVKHSNSGKMINKIIKNKYNS